MASAARWGSGLLWKVRAIVDGSCGRVNASQATCTWAALLAGRLPLVRGKPGYLNLGSTLAVSKRIELITRS
jgi:hypothetical protein